MLNTKLNEFSVEMTVNDCGILYFNLIPVKVKVKVKVRPLGRFRWFHASAHAKGSMRSAIKEVFFGKHGLAKGKENKSMPRPSDGCRVCGRVFQKVFLAGVYLENACAPFVRRRSVCSENPKGCRPPVSVHTHWKQRFSALAIPRDANAP